MSRKHFGTDGVRGIANQTLKPELAFLIGQAAGRYLHSHGLPRSVVIGRDTRRSGTMLAGALTAGLCSAGVDVLDLGIVPTPTVSYCTRTGGHGLGVVISASHNPAPDNGIKLIGHDGRKLPDEVELSLEGLMEADFDERPVGGEVGALTSNREAIDSYLEFLESIVPERLDGMKVAIDAAHGAAYELGPAILARLGAMVILTGVSPDGMNINEEGGATKPATIQRFTLESRSEIGVAFDGDADRAVFSDEQGRLINGDRTIGIWAAHYKRHGLLTPPLVVGTVMSNGGFESYLRCSGVRLERTPVGDKYVSQKIDETGALVGGEQSGHIVFPKRGPTGDGLVTMLELLRVIRTEGRSAGSFYDDYEPWPQLLVNVSVADRATWKDAAGVKLALEEGEQNLDGHGRLVVRASGTQPMVRVMVEAQDYAMRDRVADSIVQAMEREAGGKVYSRVDLTHALGD